MYYASAFTQILGNPARKPLEVVLLAGVLKFHTHPGDEIILSGEQMENESQMPLLHETEETMRIDRQSLFSVCTEETRLNIYIPEGNDLTVVLRGGQINLSGNFGQLRVRNDAGIIKAGLDHFTARGRSDLSLFAGEIKLYNGDPQFHVRKGSRYFRMPVGDGELRARVSLGQVRFKPMKDQLPAVVSENISIQL